MPRKVLFFLSVILLAAVFISLALTFPRRDNNEVELVPEITQRVFLDVDVDGQRAGFANSKREISKRHLFEENPSQLQDDPAQGYMSNYELEKAVKDFGKRCASIAKVYRAIDPFWTRFILIWQMIMYALYLKWAPI